MTKQRQTHRYRRQIGDRQGEEGRGMSDVGEGD